MDLASIYAVRALPRPGLDSSIVDVISKLKISFKPLYRRPFQATRRKTEKDDWRESMMLDVVRKVREKDDPDYDDINANINKLSKANYTKLVSDVLERLKKRDEFFRLRVTTLLFDRGIHQIFFAPLMADAYRDIVKAHPDASSDLATQITMFDTLYDTGNVTMIPASTDPGYEEAVVAWTKQKEKKRGFAVYLGELYSRGLVPEETMMTIVKTILDDLRETASTPKSGPNEEHVDALVRFIFAVASKVPIAKDVRALLAIPKASTPSLSMKSRFKLEDALK
jgi:hypothetical protein